MHFKWSEICFEIWICWGAYWFTLKYLSKTTCQRPHVNWSVRLIYVIFLKSIQGTIITERWIILVFFCQVKFINIKLISICWECVCILISIMQVSWDIFEVSNLFSGCNLGYFLYSRIYYIFVLLLRFSNEICRFVLLNLIYWGIPFLYSFLFNTLIHKVLLIT